MSVFNRIKNIQLFQPKTLLGVEVDTSNEELKLRFIEVNNSYGKIKTKSSENSWLSFDEFTSLTERNKWIPFSKQKPLCLVLTGSKVVFKKIGELTEVDDNRILQSVLPGGKPTDFLVTYDELENQYFGSAIKIETLDLIVNQFNESGYLVYSLGMGPIDSFIFSDILLRDYKIKLSNYTINIGVESASIDSTASISSVVKIDSEEISRDNILGLSAVVKAFQPNKFNLESQLLSNNLTEIKYWNYLVASLRLILVVGAFLLGTGYYLLENYQTGLIELSDATSEQNNSYRQFESVNAEYREKVSILSTAGLSTSKKTAAISDKIGILLPEEIRLIDLKIYPLTKSIKKNKRILFDRDRVFIQGVSPKSSILNDWLITLKEDDWIKEVTILNYSQTNKENPGLFEIEVKLNE